MTELPKEGSTVAGSLKGFLGPLGARMVTRKRKKNNPSKPYGEPELFENAVALAVLNDENLDEVVKKRGQQWVVVDDKTGSQLGSYKTREAAWNRQRQIRKTKAAHKRKPKPKIEKLPKAKKAKVAPKSKKAPKAKVTKEMVLNKFKDVLRRVLSEGNMISYIFEQPPVSNESPIWDDFISRLSKETVMSDSRLKNILKTIAKSEAKLLGKAVDEIKKILNATGSFDVEIGDVEQDVDGAVMLGFNVALKENGNELSFAVKIENGRPLIVFPEESRSMLNMMGSDESKLLRAELMHAQETVLNDMNDVLKVTLKRDDYLKNMESKIDKVVDAMGPLEYSMLKHLMKKKYKGVK